MTVQKILDLARTQIGNSENPAGSNRTKYGKWYGLDGNPWCSIFCSWVFNAAGSPLPVIQDKAPSGAAYCPLIENYAKKNNQWHSSPQVGDLALFHFGKKEAIHIGIVESVNGNAFKSIEGNTSVTSNDNGGKVMRRDRNISQCRGFYRPIVTPQKLGKDAYYRQIKLSNPLMEGNDVKEWQKQMNNFGYKLDPDGVYGEKSDLACRDLQKKRDLEVDGVIDPDTWRESWERD